MINMLIPVLYEWGGSVTELELFEIGDIVSSRGGSPTDTLVQYLRRVQGRVSVVFLNAEDAKNIKQLVGDSDVINFIIMEDMLKIDTFSIVDPTILSPLCAKHLNKGD